MECAGQTCHLLLQLDQHLHDLLDRGVLIEAVDVEQVDAIDPQLPKTLLARGAARLGAAVDLDIDLSVLANRPVDPELSRQEDVLAALRMLLEPSAEELLVVPVSRRRIPERFA